jgi:predicted Fe-Mo cluster-binding NifX family protein
MIKLIPIMSALFFMLSGLTFAGEKVKIAVAANDKTPGASVSKQAGPSPFFLLFDSRGILVEAIDNPNKEGEGGIAVTDFLVGKGVTVVVAQEFGSRIVRIMKEKGIRAIAFKGSAEEAVKKVLQPR